MFRVISPQPPPLHQPRDLRRGWALLDLTFYRKQKWPNLPTTAAAACSRPDSPSLTVPLSPAAAPSSPPSNEPPNEPTSRNYPPPSPPPRAPLLGLISGSAEHHAALDAELLAHGREIRPKDNEQGLRPQAVGVAGVLHRQAFRRRRAHDREQGGLVPGRPCALTGDSGLAAQEGEPHDGVRQGHTADARDQRR